VVLLYLKKKKQTTDELATLAMTTVDSRSVQPEFATRTRMGPGSVAGRTRTSTVDDDYRYERIIEILKECDPDDWESYLMAFKKEKLTDDTLKLIPCDSSDDAEAIWKGLIPQMGMRLAFKKLWEKELEHDGATPGKTTPGATVIKYAESEKVEVQLAGGGQIDRRNTSDMNLEEPECEGNETKFDDALPQHNDGIAAPAVEPDVIALQVEPPRAAFAMGTAGGPSSYDDMKMVDNESDDEENMYRPGLGRQETRGAPGGFQE